MKKKFIIEQLEERLMLSADFLPVPFDGGLPYDEWTTDLAVVETPLVPASSDSAENAELRHELVFIDSMVSEYQKLVDDIMATQDNGTYFEVIVLDSNENGIEQISETLNNYANIDAVHLFSHGADGSVQLGNTWLTLDALDAYADSIEGWKSALTNDADLLFYGCDLAAGVEGQALIDNLTILTGADIAASTDLTGLKTRGGDWILEHSTGNIETSIALSQHVQHSWDGTLATITVTSNADSGAGSLREAINTASAGDTIAFNIGGGGAQTIQLNTSLTITTPVIIDGTTQPGFSGTPLIELDGTNITNPDPNGITLQADNSTIKGLVINNCPDDGIEIEGNSNVIIGNYIGTDITGTAAQPNRWGISVKGDNNIIGGSDLTERNIISGNTNWGIGIYLSADNTEIYGNYIGTDVTGMAALGNGTNGIEVYNSSTNTIIGGAAFGEGNLISANGWSGIEIFGNGTDNSVIKGNLIGVDATGTATTAMSNADSGIYHSGNADMTVIGGTGAGEGNTIAAMKPGSDGIHIASGNNISIRGNNIFNTDGGGIVIQGAANGNVTPLTLTASTYDGLDLTVDGTYTQAPGETLTVDFYVNTSATPDQGSVYIGSGTINTDASGTFSITITPINPVNAGDYIITTVTDSLNQTSVFSNNIQTILPAKLVWADQATGKIQTSDLDGSNVTDLLTGLTSPLSVSVDVQAGKVYWSDDSDNVIRRANLDGTGIEDIIMVPSGITSIELDTANGKIYWVEGGGGQVKRADLDGSNIEGITGSPNTPTGIALDVANDKLYWADIGANNIKQTSLTGAGTGNLVNSGVDGTADIALDLAAGHLYWSDSTVGEIKRVNLDGSNIITFLGGLNNPTGLAIDSNSGKIYWTDDGTDTLYRADLVAPIPEVILSGIVTPRDVDVITLTVLNNAPTGNVTIDNTTPAQGDTLTASNTLADADGISGAISYQWQRDGVDIAGETGSQYITTQADVGKVISVVAKYTDDLGVNESVSSAATAAVSNLNDTPTGSVTIDNTTPAQGDTLTASNTLADADGLSGAISYQWQRDGVDIAGETGSQYITTQADVGKVISVVAKYTDDLGANESVSSAATAAVSNLNDTPTGSVTIDNTTPAQGDTLTASNTLADADGLSGPISYQWQRDGVDIAGETGSSYTTTQADVGSLITVVAKYTDDLGANESVSSAATSAVTNANDAPVIGGVDTGAVTEDIDPDNDGNLETSGAMTISDSDPGEDRFAEGTIAGTYGSLTIIASGQWSYTADNSLTAIQQLAAGSSLVDKITVTTEDGTNHDIVVTISGTNDTPTVSAASNDTGAEDRNKVFTHAELLVFTGAADIDDVDTDLTISISNVTNGTLNLTGGTGGAGTTFTFTPDLNFVGNMTFDYQVSDDSGASSAVGTASIALNPVGDSPQVSNTGTLPDTLSDPIVISPNASDGVEVTHFQITGITNGTLYHADGTTPINNGDYITLTEAQDGLKFQLASNTAFGSFNVRPSKDGSSVDPDSGSATPIITVLSAPPVPDAGDTAEEPVVEDQEMQEDTTADDPLNDATGNNAPLSYNTPQKKSFITSDASAAKSGVYQSQVKVDFKPVMERLSRIQESESSNILSTLSLEQKFNKILDKLPDFRISYENLKNSLDDFRKEAEIDMHDSETVIGSAIAVSTGLSVGYVIWMIRGGMLLSSLISSMPAWQLADPLPILKNTRNDEDDEDDESLETIIKKSSDNDDKKKQDPDVTEI